MSLFYSNQLGGRVVFFTILCESVDTVTQLNCFKFLWILPPTFAQFPMPTLAHFLNVVFSFNMIWIFLWHINVLNVRQKSVWPFPRAGNSLICSLLIRSLLIRSFAQFAQINWATMSDSLRSLETNEPLWANHSGRSRQISEREQIAQVTHNKWATVSDSLRSLIINEQMSDLLKFFG